MSGKGSKQRPTDQKRFSENYDKIWGSKGCYGWLYTEEPKEKPIEELYEDAKAKN